MAMQPSERASFEQAITGIADIICSSASAMYNQYIHLGMDKDAALTLTRDYADKLTDIFIDRMRPTERED